MKKKNLNNDLVTKSYLKRELEVSKSYLKRELKITKSYLKRELEVSKASLKNYLNLKLDDFREEIKQQLTEFRSKILDAVDTVLKEVLAMREEQTLHFHQHERIDETLEDHEERIKEIETHKFA